MRTWRPLLALRVGLLLVAYAAVSALQACFEGPYRRFIWGAATLTLGAALSWSLWPSSTSRQAESESVRIVVQGDEDAVYTRDQSLVYRAGEPVRDANPETFVVITAEYGKDDTSVFFAGKRMAALDPASFEVLAHGYSKDATTVLYDFYSGQTILGADPSTFRVLDLDMSKDKNWVYEWTDLETITKLDEADASSFQNCEHASCGASSVVVSFIDVKYQYVGGEVIAEQPDGNRPTCCFGGE